MASREPGKAGFPPAFAALFAVLAVGLIGGGLTLWLPVLNKDSSANSDLGLALLGGGIAMAAGALVSYAVFTAERRVDAKLEASDEARERTGLQLALATAPSLRGVDLEGRDLSGFVLRNKDLSHAKLGGAKLRGADLSGSDLSSADFHGADLSGALLQRTTLAETNFTAATLTEANFDGAVVHFLYTEREEPDRIYDATPVFTDAIGLDPRYGPSTPQGR